MTLNEACRVFSVRDVKGSGVTFVLECYLDDSDNHEGPSMGIAGFVSFTDDWLEFEREVEPYLQRYGVDVLRGKDFQNGHNAFKGWDGPKKADFVEGLFQIAGHRIISGVNSVVSKKFFSEQKKINSDLSNLSPLGLAFASAVLSTVSKDLIGSLDFSGQSISFVVELGNTSNQNLVKYFKWIKDNIEINNISLGDIRFVGKKDCRAVQLADFLAFHGRREADRWEESSFVDKESRGHAMAIMHKYVMIRHNRFRSNGNPIPWVDLPRFEEGIEIPDEHNVIILPKGGLK
jgi:hypothetical protein